MNNIFVTSDTHLGHNKDFIYEDRGYKSIEEMNKDLIQKWNSVVDNNDTVYHLGDVMLGDLNAGMECLRELNGNIFIIRGNHDSDKRVNEYLKLPNVSGGVYAEVIKYHKRHIYLSHYPTICSNYDDFKGYATVNLCGHSHTTNPFADFDKGLIYHCEVDAHGGFPVLLDGIQLDIAYRVTTGE